MDIFTFTGFDRPLPGYLWLPAGTPRAAVLLLHGMTEHAGRFEPLGAMLAQNRIAAAAFDIRGHGQHPGGPECADMDRADWSHTLEDIRLVLEALEERFPGVPVFLLGFSLGSFLVREYLMTHADLPAGVILIGTGHQPAAVLSIMKWVVGTQRRQAVLTTPLIRKLSFETYNRKFQPSKTRADWLCADESALLGYLSDPLCRQDISAALFYELLCSMDRTGRPDAYPERLRKLPFLLLSGGDDPVGDFGRGVLRVHKAMKRTGLLDVTTHLYPKARHDLLHEEASGQGAKARQEILQWVEAHIQEKTASPVIG